MRVTGLWCLLLLGMPSVLPYNITTKQKTVGVGAATLVGLGVGQNIMQHFINKQEDAAEEARYKTPQKFEVQDKNLKRKYMQRTLLRAAYLITAVGTVWFAYKSMTELGRDSNERDVRNEENRILAGPRHTASNGKNDNDQVYRARQEQLLGSFALLGRPTPDPVAQWLYGKPGADQVTFPDPEVPGPDTWDLSKWGTTGRAVGLANKALIVFYVNHLKGRIRRFTFILDHWDDIDVKLLRGALPFKEQENKPDQQVRDTVKVIFERDLPLMQQELVALEKVLAGPSTSSG